MGIFSKNKTVQLQDIRSLESQALGKDYLSKLQSAMSGYNLGEDFGSVSVGLSDAEKQSLGYLSNYLNTDITKNDLYQAGRGEISNTLAGTTYDPTTGQYYKATRAAMDLSTQKSIDEARRGQAVRGAFRSSGGLRQEGDILTESNVANQQLLANLAEKERERRATAGTQALELAEYESNIPLNKTKYAQLYGALERENEISNLEREYNKWSNQRQELMKAFTMSGEASNMGQPIYGQTSYTTKESTGLGKLASAALTLGGAYLGGGSTLGGIFTTGGATGAKVGSTLGDILGGF